MDSGLLTVGVAPDATLVAAAAPFPPGIEVPPKYAKATPTTRVKIKKMATTTRFLATPRLVTVEVRPLTAERRGRR